MSITISRQSLVSTIMQQAFNTRRGMDILCRGSIVREIVGENDFLVTDFFIVNNIERERENIKYAGEHRTYYFLQKYITIDRSFNLHDQSCCKMYENVVGWKSSLN